MKLFGKYVIESLEDFGYFLSGTWQRNNKYLTFWYWRERIANLIVWFPVIWKDREWDYVYMLKILRFKLVRMENFFRNSSIVANAEKDADKIKKCILTLDRLIAEDYYKIKEAKKEEEMHMQDIEYLFTTMKKHMRSWWD